MPTVNKTVHLYHVSVSGNIRAGIADAFKKDKDPFKCKAILLTEKIKKSETLKYIIEHWDNDEEFARQVNSFCMNVSRKKYVI